MTRNGSPIWGIQNVYTDGNGWNNGNLMQQTILPLGATQSFAYDGANRLASASESGGGGWSQTYGYDAFGNRWRSGQTGSGMPSGVAYQYQPTSANWFLAGGTSNRMRSPSDPNVPAYDAVGNQLTVAGPASPSPFVMNYDHENRQIGSTDGNLVYSYDGEGRRVQSVAWGVTRNFVYDATGALAAEYSTSANYLATPGTWYLAKDQVGSTRVAVPENFSGARLLDYLPFGESLTAGRGSGFLEMLARQMTADR